MKAMVRTVNDHGLEYICLMFVCPGCVDMVGGSGLHMLPVNSPGKSPVWEWDGNLIRPTVSPSILTGKGTTDICHSFLRNGIFQFLDDCVHSFAGKSVEIPDLPQWVIDEEVNP